MSRRTRSHNVALISGSLGLAAILASTVPLLMSPVPPSTGILHHDVVRGNGGKRYHRLVRAELSKDCLTTTVTFTNLANGGVGRAVFVQPTLLLEPRWKQVVRQVRALFLPSVIGAKDLPFMVIPDPIEPGQRWTVYLRVDRTRREVWVEGYGKRPKQATIDTVPSFANPWLNPLVNKDASVVYGECLRLDW